MKVMKLSLACCLLASTHLLFSSSEEKKKPRPSGTLEMGINIARNVLSYNVRSVVTFVEKNKVSAAFIAGLAAGVVAKVAWDARKPVDTKMIEAIRAVNPRS